MNNNKNNSGLIELSPALLNQISGGCVGFDCGGSSNPFDGKNPFAPKPKKPDPFSGLLPTPKPISPIFPKFDMIIG